MNIEDAFNKFGHLAGDKLPGQREFKLDFPFPDHDNHNGRKRKEFENISEWQANILQMIPLKYWKNNNLMWYINYLIEYEVKPLL